MIPNFLKELRVYGQDATLIKETQKRGNTI